jgi:hypothetical protein
MNFRTALIPVIIALVFIPAFAEACSPTPCTALSSLTSASSGNSFDNGSDVQTWNWSTLGSGPGLELLTNGTAAGTAGSEVLEVASTGNNSQSGVPTKNAYFANLTIGTNSTNYGLYAEADSASTNNYAVYGVVNVTNVQGAPNAGDAGVWGAAIGTSGATYGVEGTNASATGYAGYFNNSAGGYAGAFMGGNVGIGTATPLNLLDIGTSGGIHIASGIPGSTSMALYNNSGTLTWNGIALATGSSVSGTTNYIPVFTGSNSLGDSVIYQSGSNVGIGTASPINSLDIYGGVAIGTGYAGSDTAPSNGLLVQGNVGIGTTSPNSLLALVDGYITINPVTVYGSPSTQIGPDNMSFNRVLATGALYSANAFAYQWQHTDSTTAANDFLALQVYNTSGTQVTSGALAINGSGNIGIKTTSPAYTLQVNGSVAGTSAYINTSDIRYKKNIEPLQIGLNEVEQLRPVSFEWKESKDNGMQGRQIGFIAQDVEKILPSIVVTQDNPEQTKGMKYAEIIPVLTKAIQQLNDTLVDEQDTIARQQTEIDELRQTNTAMKAKLGM